MENSATFMVESENSLYPIIPVHLGTRLRRRFSSRIKRLTLIAPPDADKELFNYSTAKLNRYLNYPPYGFAVLAQLLRKVDVECKIISLQTAVLKAAKEIEEPESFDFDSSWKQELDGLGDSDTIALTCMFSQGQSISSRVMKYLHELYPGIPLIFGGVHVTNMLVEPHSRDLFLDDFPSCDLFFLFEADETLPAFIQAVNTSTPENFSVKYRPSQIYIRQIGLFPERKTPREANLDIIPAWDLIPPKQHSPWGKVGAFWYLRHRDPVTATVLSNRGCRAQCTFCSVRSFNGVGVRRRSVASVIDELKILQNQFGVEHIMWLDDDFFYNEAQTLKLFDEIVKANIKITWDCSNGVLAASCTPEILDGARSSGCIGLIIGMESGSPKILKQIKKPGAVKTFLSAAENLKAVPEIHSRLFLMIGFPGETFRDVRLTFEVAREMNMDWANIAPLQPLPNTPIFDTMVSEGLIDPQTKDSYTNLRFNSGAYSKASQHARESKDLLSNDFTNVFDTDENRIPTRDEIDLLWGYLNYHLNFERLKQELSPIKRVLTYSYLSFITNSIAPNNAIALYFKLMLSDDVDNYEEDLSRLAGILNTNRYWKQRFSDFRLNITDIKSQKSLG